MLVNVEWVSNFLGNPNFEQDRGWTYRENGDPFSGNYATDDYHSSSKII